MKKFLLALTALFSVMLMTQMAAAENKTVTVDCDSAYAPFEFQNSNQEYVGLDVDIIKEVAKRSNWTLVLRFPGFNAALNNVLSNQADGLMAGTTITDERKKVLTFSEPYFDTKIVVATNENNKVTSYRDLKNKTVAAKTGTASAKFLDSHQEKYGYTLKTFETGDQMYDSLRSGSIYAVMDDEAVIQYAIAQGQKLAINMPGESIGSFGFSVKKGSKNDSLIQDFNRAIAAMKEDGTYQKIINKWLAGTTTDTDYAKNLTLTGDATKVASPKKKTYIIYSDSAFAPFEFKSGNQYIGIDMDLIRAIAKQQGFDVVIQNGEFDAALNSVKTGQADGIIAGMTVTDERKKTFDFSDPYYTSNIRLAVKKGSKIRAYDDLKDKKVGAKAGTASSDWLQKHAKEYGYTVETVQDGTALYNNLQSSSVDAIMDDEAVLLYAIDQGREFETPIEGIKSGELAFAVKKGSNPELIDMFNNGLANLIESGEYNAIMNKYLAEKPHKANETVNYTIFGLLQENWKPLLGGLWTTILLSLISFAIALVIGILVGMCAVSPVRFLRGFASIFVDLVRGVPLMIVAAFIFWGIPNLMESLLGRQSPIDAFAAGVIALSLNSGAYIAEIVRAGIQAVPQGQMEASRSLGISYSKTMQKIILPQATKLMIPNLINQFVITLKDTTIISAIGLTELFKVGKDIIATNYQSFRMYAILAIIYLIVITLLTRLARRLEKKGGHA